MQGKERVRLQVEERSTTDAIEQCFPSHCRGTASSRPAPVAGWFLLTGACSAGLAACPGWSWLCSNGRVIFSVCSIRWSSRYLSYCNYKTPTPQTHTWKTQRPQYKTLLFLLFWKAWFCLDYNSCCCFAACFLSLRTCSYYGMQYSLQNTACPYWHQG